MKITTYFLLLTLGGCSSQAPTPVVPTPMPAPVATVAPTAIPTATATPTPVAPTAAEIEESNVAIYLNAATEVTERIARAEKMSSAAQALAEIKQAAVDYRSVPVPASMTKADSLMSSSIEREFYAYAFIDSAQQFSSPMAMEEARAPFMEAGELRGKALVEVARVAREVRARR